MTTLEQTQPPTALVTDEERWPTTQAYLSDAFTWWRRANGNRDLDLTFVELVSRLSGAGTLACLAGKLNQQVFNGGLGQWVDNRYVDVVTLRELIYHVTMVHRHEVANSGPGAASVGSVVSLLRQVQHWAVIDRVWDDRLQTEAEMERFSRNLRQLTPTYVEHGEAFMDAVERYLVAAYPRPQSDAPAPAPTPVPSDALSHRAALREVLDALGALTNPSELHDLFSDEDLQRRILEAAERPE